MRENREDKAARLLVQRRVDVLKADSTGIWATVRGDTATYKTKWRRRGQLLVGECTCAGIGEKCSHLSALRMIWTGEKR